MLIFPFVISRKFENPLFDELETMEIFSIWMKPFCEKINVVYKESIASMKILQSLCKIIL